MQINDWVDKRRKRGTLADIARRIVQRDAPYREAERQLRRLYTLESLIKAECNQQAAMDAIGMSRQTLYRNLQPFVMTDVIAAAKAIKGEQ